MLTWRFLGMIFAIPEDDPVLRGEELPLTFFHKKLPFVPDPKDPAVGLTKSAAEALIKEARRLKMKAQKEVELVKVLYVPNEPLDDTVPGRLLQIAAEAVTNPQLLENREFVPMWAVWWQKSHKLIPYDMRLDAERFLGYIMDRLSNRLVKASSLLAFERDFDEEYVRAKNREIDAKMLQSGVSGLLGLPEEARVAPMVTELKVEIEFEVEQMMIPSGEKNASNGVEDWEKSFQAFKNAFIRSISFLEEQYQVLKNSTMLSFTASD